MHPQINACQDLKSHRDYQTIERTLNGIDLLRVIKLIYFNIEDEN